MGYFNSKPLPEISLELKPFLEESLYKPIIPIQNGWLSFIKEREQTVEQHFNRRKNVPDEYRCKLYLVILDNDIEDIHYLQEYISIFFNLHVEIIHHNINYKNIKSRFNDDLDLDQYLSGDFRKELLNLNPLNAFGIIGLTSKYLHDDDTNFIFGDTEYYGRVSILTYFNSSIEIMLKLAVHEIGHLYNIRHCIKHSCIMQGFNGLQELKSLPFEYCRFCIHKLYNSYPFNPKSRNENLKKILIKYNLIGLV